MLSDNPIPSEFTPEGHADPGGDVIFSLDTESTPTDGQHHLLKVSSQTMSRASPAFRAMFNPRFTGRADFSPHDSLEIALPVDDYQAMTWICFALHLQDLPEGRMPLALLKKIALLADKYNLARKLQPWSRLWLDEWSDSAAHDENYWELLWVAYALLDVQIFYEASERLIYGKATEDPDFDSDSLDGVGLSLLPAGIIASIKAQRCFATDNMQKLLGWVTPLCLDESRRHDHEFKEELTRLGLIPIKSVLEERGITHFIDKLHDVSMHECVILVQPGPEVSICQAGHLKMSYIYKAKEAMLGMCLLCLKQGKKTPSLDSFSTEASNDIDLRQDGAIALDRGSISSAELEWNFERYWSRRKTIRNDEVERNLTQVIKDKNCMASTRREHQRNLKHTEECGKTGNLELSENRGWAGLLQYMEQNIQADDRYSAIC